MKHRNGQSSSTSSISWSAHAGGAAVMGRGARSLHSPALFPVVLAVWWLVLCAFAPLAAKRTAPTDPENPTELSLQVLVNQVGYLAAGPKKAMLQVSGPGLSALRLKGLYLLDESAVRPPLRLTLPSLREWEGRRLGVFDFSALDVLGSYRIRLEAELAGERRIFESLPFQVGRSELDRTHRLMLRSYFLQRCGVAVQDHGSGMERPACHLEDGVAARGDHFVDEGGRVAATGGWHDAGDYGKYVAPAAVAVAQLLVAYLDRPGAYPDGQLDIPESRNGRSDLLDEIRFELDWLLRMQRPDGAVYRKLSGARWPHDTTPHDDAQTRYVYGVSTAETAKFAAVMALGARAFVQSGQQQYGAQLLRAARRAWLFLEEKPLMWADWQKSDDTGSGKYMLSNTDREQSLTTDFDDRAWAAVELYLATGEERFEARFARYVVGQELELFEWKNALLLGVENYLLGDQPRAPRLERLLRERVLKRAEKVWTRAQLQPWRLANQRFIWGSNKMAAQEGFHLLRAVRLGAPAKYVETAIDQVNFLLGMNPFDQTFVTGVGEQPVRNLCHLYGTKAGLTIPGLMVGGPNSAAQAGLAPKDQGVLSYIDHRKSYATNEYAIDYNSALIGLLALLLQPPI